MMHLLGAGALSVPGTIHHTRAQESCTFSFISILLACK